jgi:PAS domain S-box-containing protein
MTADVQYQSATAPKILVVDDEARIRDACREVLGECGYQVTVAEDGARGLALIEESHFDIVLLDLMMPVLSGVDVLERVKDLHSDTVVIVITGYATVEHSIEAMKNGAFDFISKPFTPEHLRVTVAKAIEYIRALHDIADTHSRIRTMVHRLSDGVMCTNDLNQIVLANPAFLQMAGSTAGRSVVGEAYTQVVPLARLREMISETLAGTETDRPERSDEIELVGEGGDQGRILSARCTPFRNRTGATMGVITVLHDITALKTLDRMKSEFVSMVSHEIRGPLNSVLMQLRVILDGLAGEVTEKQRQILDRATDKISNLSSMTSELLDLARIESGLISQEMERVDLGPLLLEQVAFHGPRAESAAIELTLDAPPNLPPVMAHRRNMEEVVSNLIVNAIKYTPAGGKITVSAAAGEDNLVIKVADTGFGIAPDDQKQVFQRFYRVKNEQTRYVNGTGLGLSIVKSIVASHHGNVTLESSPGTGSTFSVFLPLSAA